jgi:hypothetical protein
MYLAGRRGAWLAPASSNTAATSFFATADSNSSKVCTTPSASTFSPNFAMTSRRNSSSVRARATNGHAADKPASGIAPANIAAASCLLPSL